MSRRRNADRVPQKVVSASHATYATSVPENESFRLLLSSGTLRVVALVLLQFAVSLPYLVYGIGYVREEWTFLGDAQAGGAWNAALESTRHARPVVAALYAAIYGFAENQMVWHLALIGFNAAIAVALFGLLRAWMSQDNAFLVAAVWVLLPTHMTLDHWLAATNITLSLLLLLLGLTALTRSIDLDGHHWPPTVLLCASALLYDAIIPVALAGLLTMPMMRHRSPRQWLVRGGIPLAVIGGYVAVQFRDRGSELASPLVAIGQNLFYGLSSVSLVETLLVCTILLGCTLAVRDAMSKRSESSRLIFAGFVVMLIGIAPFLTSGFDAQFIGLGDRMNMIASIGAALVLVGVMRQLTSGRFWAVGLVLVLAASIVPVRLDQDQRWSEISSYAKRAAVQVANTTTLNQVSLRRNPLVDEPMPGTRSDVEVGRVLRAGVMTRRIDVLRDTQGLPIVTGESIVLPH